MRTPIQLFPIRRDAAPAERQAQRLALSSYLGKQGAGLRPNPPRDLVVQPAPRGIRVDWALPDQGETQIFGWRILEADGVTVRDRIPDRAARTYLFVGTAGTMLAGHVASVSADDIASTPVRFDGTAISEAGAPSSPSSPPGYTSGGGSDTFSGATGARQALL